MDEEILFSNHARQQLIRRSIGIAAVRLAITESDYRFEERPGRMRFIKRVYHVHRQMVLVVICDVRDEELIVVTAFQSSKTQKYLGAL